MLKLFVWDGDDIPPEYFRCMACALAHDLEQARQLLEESYPGCEFIQRDPDRILDKPSAVFQLGV